jgi:hypothetical protein
MLELDVHPGAELLDIERRRLLVDPDLLADPPCVSALKWLVRFTDAD